MKILGLMSGTSLDGIDLALCHFTPGGYTLVAATTVAYSEGWRSRLATLEHASALDYALADMELGHLFGQAARAFLGERGERADAIASHGHTIFHQPQHGLTTQIGNADAIAAETGLPVVANFRTLDVALGGQGAPLVPIGDELLFGHHDACLNLGGIANISYREAGRRVAFDLCPCNMGLNRLAARLGLAYDPDGAHARAGRCSSTLLARLEALPYYALPGPKSLGKEWFDECFWPIVEASQLPPDDLLATATEHTARQVARVLRRQRIGTLLATGGGAHNRFLVERIAALAPQTALTVPDPLTVDYKEALIFALLGKLRLEGRANTLASVTGARADSVGGNLSGLPPQAAQI